MIEHGGRLRAAAARWSVPLDQWLDLSTGIAPWAYPLAAPPPEVWQRLPEDEDGLDAAARCYYAAPHLLGIPGSQAAIQWLPRLLPGENTAVIAPAYGEYAEAATAAGRRVTSWDANCLAEVCEHTDLLILGNPNNPDGARFSRAQLHSAALALAGHGGWLVVDEAFADADDAATLSALAGSGDYANVVVLRSLGKFFGLAGARVGFALTAPPLLERLQAALGPWAIAHPARWAAQQALADTDWQAGQRARLRAASARLEQLLIESGVGAPHPAEVAVTGSALFRYVRLPQATALHDWLARQGILVRLLATPAALRFGLPGTEAQWQRLTTALHGRPA